MDQDTLLQAGLVRELNHLELHDGHTPITRFTVHV